MLCSTSGYERGAARGRCEVWPSWPACVAGGLRESTLTRWSVSLSSRKSQNTPQMHRAGVPVRTESYATSRASRAEQGKNRGQRSERSDIAAASVPRTFLCLASAASRKLRRKQAALSTGVVLPVWPVWPPTETHETHTDAHDAVCVRSIRTLLVQRTHPGLVMRTATLESKWPRVLRFQLEVAGTPATPATPASWPVSLSGARMCTEQGPKPRNLSGDAWNRVRGWSTWSPKLEQAGRGVRSHAAAKGRAATASSACLLSQLASRLAPCS